jgi:hypothetical protein
MSLLLAFHDVFDLKEDRIFKDMVVFGVFMVKHSPCPAWTDQRSLSMRLWHEDNSLAACGVIDDRDHS